MSFPHGEREDGDPGRHRPMSATHDNALLPTLFSMMDTHRLGSLLTASPRGSVALGVTPSMPAPAGSWCGSAGVVFPRDTYVPPRSRGGYERTGCAPSPHGSPAEHDSRPLASARGPSVLRARAISGQPPDGLDRRSRRRVNGPRLRYGPEHLRSLRMFFSLVVRGAAGIRLE